LYKVVEERTQKPDAEQTDTIKARAFQNWYGEKKDAGPVTRQLLTDLGIGGPGGRARRARRGSAPPLGPRPRRRPPGRRRRAPDRDPARGIARRARRDAHGT